MNVSASISPMRKTAKCIHKSMQLSHIDKNTHLHTHIIIYVVFYMYIHKIRQQGQTCIYYIYIYIHSSHWSPIVALDATRSATHFPTSTTPCRFLKTTWWAVPMAPDHLASYSPWVYLYIYIWSDGQQVQNASYIYIFCSRDQTQRLTSTRYIYEYIHSPMCWYMADRRLCEQSKGDGLQCKELGRLM